MIQKKNICCPHCNKENTWIPENPFRPFCSERCKLIDLGSWADEKFKVPGEPVNLNDQPDDNNEDR